MRRAPTVAAAILTFLFLLAGPPSALAAPGDLDPSFSGDGKVTTNFTTRSDFAIDVALQADGKVVAAGLSGLGGVDQKFALSRYNPDGSLDATFSGDGKITTNFGSREDAANDVVIQIDGKILASGLTYLSGVDGRFALARYNEDGTLDTTFSVDGRVITNFTRYSDSVQGVVVLSDGKIVAAGIAGYGGPNAKFAMARYNADGSLDSSFDGDGKVTTDFSAAFDGAFGIALQGDAKLVLGGSAGGFGGRFAVARYNEDGSLDSTFSGDGKATANFTSRLDEALGVVLLPGGQIVLAGGAAFNTSNTRFALAQFNSDGTLDTSFGGDGKVTTSFTARWEFASDVRIQSAARIVAVGEASFSSSNSRFALARYTSDGSLDTSFGGDGKVTTDFTGGHDSAVGVEIQTDDKIVAAGAAGSFTGRDTRFALARYEAA